tara:strand:+ start:540 stop:740 length:201 start_codon:yes stop_codon:yes gene_type:complete
MDIIIEQNETESDQPTTGMLKAIRSCENIIGALVTYETLKKEKLSEEIAATVLLTTAAFQTTVGEA